MTKPGKVAICVPFLERPTTPFIEALEKSMPLVTGAGWEHCVVQEIGCPYVGHARATMLRKALDAKADVIVFLDYDLSWPAGDLLRLIETPGDVVAGTYRYKKADEEYMGALTVDDDDGKAHARDDGCLVGYRIPAGFLKITKFAVNRIMTAYPDLIYGPKFNPSVDLFRHGAHAGIWEGEDIAFSRRWLECGGDIWVIPDLALTHHSASDAYPGNLDKFLRSQPGGVLAPAAA